jgi:hypothetical protein
MHALQMHYPASRVHFCSWFLQSVIEGEIDPRLTVFSDDVWFQLQGYINMQNNHYWSLENPHLTHKVMLPPVKIHNLFNIHKLLYKYSWTSHLKLSETTRQHLLKMYKTIHKTKTIQSSLIVIAPLKVSNPG